MAKKNPTLTTDIRFITNIRQNKFQTSRSRWMVSGPDSGLRLSAHSPNRRRKTSDSLVETLKEPLVEQTYFGRFGAPVPCSPHVVWHMKGRQSLLFPGVQEIRAPVADHT